MTEAHWLAAALIGLAGGVHCAGMCGGIVAVLTFARGGREAPLAFTAAYHAGRIASYVAAGAIAGALGQTGLALRGTPAIQIAFFTLASATLVASGLYLAGAFPALARLEAAGGVLWRRIEPLARPLLPLTSPARAFAAGTLWGWLPCGMVYGVLLLAFATASAAGGALTMLAFGAGTLPNLIGIGLALRHASRRCVSPGLRRLAGALVVALGIYGMLHVADRYFGVGLLCVVP